MPAVVAELSFKNIITVFTGYHGSYLTFSGVNDAHQSKTTLLIQIDSSSGAGNPPGSKDFVLEISIPA